MISTAYAASAEGASTSAFYDSPTFWVAVSFVLFVLIFAKPV